MDVRRLFAQRSGKFIDWTQPAGGKAFTKVQATPLEDLEIESDDLLLSGKEATDRTYIGKGAFGIIMLYKFPQTDKRLPGVVAYTHIIVKQVDIATWPRFLTTELINGIKTARELETCDLIRFRAWITKLNLPDSKPGLESESGAAAIPSRTVSLDASEAVQSTDAIVDNITDDSLLVVAMQPADGDGLKFLTTKWYQEDPNKEASEDTEFAPSLANFASFLNTLKACLDSNSATFADMKLANVGYVSKEMSIQWRLLDIDGINGQGVTFPYTRTPGQKNKQVQTAYAFGVTVAEYAGPKFGILLEELFYRDGFDPQRCKEKLMAIHNRITEMIANVDDGLSTKLNMAADFVANAKQILDDHHKVTEKRGRFTVTS